jgi:hypothetical protein
MRKTGALNERERLFESRAWIDKTEHRNMPPMPVVVLYRSTLSTLWHLERNGGITSFLSSTSTQGYRRGILMTWAKQPLNAHAVLKRFLELKTEGEILEFLHNTGEFRPGEDTITLHEFKRWQRCAEMVMDPRELREYDEQSQANPEMKRETESDAARLTAMLNQLPPQWPHLFFEADSPFFLRENETQENCAARIAALDHDKIKRQWDMEGWFVTPPQGSFSVEWIPRQYNDLDEEMHLWPLGGIIGKDDLAPFLIIRPTHTLQAIAAAIYANRITNVRHAKCKGCGVIFEIGAQKSKLYHDRKCQDRFKKKNSYVPKAERPATPQHDHDCPN